ncbi:MAG: heavy metal-associated domain-containing protein [Rhodospirillaceae bacterium]|nr:heavy metal-associated domain-containing protein [Rhodospirillaceae bacterium]
MDTITIPVEGMTCGGCVKSVERMLTHQPGVTGAKASMEAKNVVVNYDAAAISRAEMEQAIRKAGFKVPA